jgi:membrane protease YdiL (CAAX protease family)
MGIALNESSTGRFGTPAPEARRAEWKRLGLFVAIGAALFLLAVVGAAFVPFSWPNGIRRAAHATIFVPLGLALTIRMLRKDASELPPEALFNPWPIDRMSAHWLLAGIVLSCIVAVAFVLAFSFRWTSNAHWSVMSAALMLWAILLIAAAEEISFRGYAFWRLIRLLGFWPAQAIVAALFVLSHLTLGGSAFFPALIGNVTGSVLYGVVFVRTRGVAAPIALHSGWNIAQHLLLSPLDPSATPLVPAFPHAPTQMEYAGMLAVIGIVMVGATIVIFRGAKSHAIPESDS